MDRRAFLLALAPAVSCRRKPETGFRGRAFVANEEGRSIAVVDLSKFRVQREIAIEGAPTAILSHRTFPSVYALTPQTGVVHELDPDNFTVRRKARVAPSAISMRLTPDGQSLWILSREARALIQLPLETFQPGARIRLPGPPDDFDLSAGTAAISMAGEGAVAIADLRTAQVGRVIPTGPDVRAVRFYAQGRRFLCGNRGNRTVSVGDVAQARIVAHLPVAVEPENFCFKKANDGEMYVTGAGGDALVVIYPYQSEVHETRLIGRSPGAMAASRSPEYLFVANTESGNVTVMDVISGKIRSTIAVGAEPRHIAITPDDQFAMTLNSRSGDMAVIYISEFVSDRRARTASPLLTMIPVGAKPVGVAIRTT
jgi:YVTN family beta-propeller protein